MKFLKNFTYKGDEYKLFVLPASDYEHGAVAGFSVTIVNLGSLGYFFWKKGLVGYHWIHRDGTKLGHKKQKETDALIKTAFPELYDRLPRKH